MSSAEPSKRQWPTSARLSDLWTIVLSIMIWRPSLSAIWRGHLRSNAMLFLLSVCVPALFFCFAMFGPLIYPPLTPVRWAENSSYPKRLSSLATWCVGLAIFGLIASFPLELMDWLAARWPNADRFALDGFWALFLWGLAITRYSEDRRPLPPSAPQPELKPNWADAKPIQSEHWGHAARS